MMDDEFGFYQQPKQQPEPAPGTQQQSAGGQQQSSSATPPPPPPPPPAGSYTPPAGGYTPPNGGYTPPAGGYYNPGKYSPPYTGGKFGKGGGWIGFLRVFLWIWFGLICLAGLIGFFGSTAAGGKGALLGLLILAAAVLIAFLSVAGGMVALDAAANINRCATNSARILELLQQQQKK